MQVAEEVPVVVYRRKLKKYSAEGVDLFRFRGGVPLRQFRPTLESTMGCLAGEKHDLRLSARSYALRPCNKNPASRALKVDIQSARTATEVWGRRYKEALPRRHKGSRGLSISCFRLMKQILAPHPESSLKEAATRLIQGPENTRHIDN